MIARRYLALLLTAFAALSLLIAAMACSASGGPKLVSHTFMYDGKKDGWAKDVDLLAYSYGDRYSTVQQQASEGSSLPVEMHFSGAMPRGEFLYVKWRIKSTGEVVEKRVDLKDRLPKDMLGHKVTFVIDGKQLHVFVATPEKLSGAPRAEALRTWLAGVYVTYEVYPASAFNVPM